MNFEHKVRKNVKCAQRNEVQIILDFTGERFEDFLKIYRSTLDRRDAEGQYYFENSYFERIHNTLKGQFVYFYAIHQQRVISTELVLISEDNVYSFLGGTDRDFFSLRPNDLLNYEVILWAKKNGKKRFVLGGGYEANDGIFKYKSAFAPDGKIEFYLGTRVFNNELYTKLIDTKRKLLKDKGTEWNPQYGYVPEYRT
jgi:lipid II:glycine glycyltransferase (peptidoglycan interpeptide bridge formation enzyme)